ncbi:hypothetical protein BLA29_014437, partial [Euroglyphus maynei]
YILELSNGQRKYSKKQCPTTLNNDDDERLPGPNTEIFVGKIPKNMFEDEIVPLFEQIAQIHSVRLMMDPMTGQSRGYAFITYFQPEHANAAVE